MSDEALDLASPTPDVTERLLACLRSVAPGVLVDGVLDTTRLSEVLSVPVAAAADGRDRFGLTWAGKRQAVTSLMTGSRGALIPDPARSRSFERARDVLVEGDNLEVLKLLQKAYNDKVKLIYIDPPYNTGEDFIYTDDFSDGLRAYLQFTDQLDASGNRLAASADMAGRRHSRWLTMMYPRLALARNLLSQDGIIAISIDDRELHNLLALLRELFGEENFITLLNWKKRGTGGQVAKNAIINQVEYIAVFARNADEVRLTGLPNENSGAEKWRDLRKAGGQWQRRYRPGQYFPIFALPDGSVSLDETEGSAPVYPVDADGEEGFWENGPPTVRARIARGELRAREVRGRLKIEQFEVGKDRTSAGNFLDVPSTRGTERLKALLGGVVFENPKPPEIINYLLEISDLQDGDIVLDFFAGSGTTADAVVGWRQRTGTDAHFLLVNIDDPVPEGSEAALKGYRRVSEVTYARTLAAMQDHGTEGLRVFRLGASAFNGADPTAASHGATLPLTDKTLVGDVESAESVSAEVLLGEGVGLHADWSLETVAGVSLVASGGVAVVVGPELDAAAIDRVLDLKPRVIVLLEDDLAGRDALKANAFTNASNRGIVMKTV